MSCCLPSSVVNAFKLKLRNHRQNIPEYVHIESVKSTCPSTSMTFKLQLSFKCNILEKEKKKKVQINS